MQTGELCSGDWSERTDTWVVTGYRYDATKPMVEPEFSGANNLLSQFVESNKMSGAVKIKQYLVDNLGIEHLMACEPPTISNQNSYKLIAYQPRKDGDRTDAAYIEKNLLQQPLMVHANQYLNSKNGETYNLSLGRHSISTFCFRGNA
jgi:hypothetical protein